MNAHETLTGIRESFAFLLPEFILAAGIIVITLCVAIRNASPKLPGVIAVVCLLSATALVILTFSTRQRVFLGQLSIDNYGSCLKILISMASVFCCLLSIKNEKLKQRAPEFFILILAAVLGSYFLVMSSNLLLIFLSLEIVSICSYLLAAFAFDKSGSEASMKYFMFGSVASAVMLYGLSMFYGFAGTLDMLSQEFLESFIGLSPWLLMLMASMVFAGFFFKLGAVPFHLWVPDAYQGAPAHVVAFLSTVPKLAGLGVFGRFLIVVNGSGAGAIDWRVIISALAVLTITAGNVGALVQRNAKRMMAWSSISQAGFLMIGLGVLSPVGISHMLFYAAVYVAMNILVFVFLESYERRGINEIQDFSGIGKSETIPIILLTIGFISLTGLPPTAGFTAKLLVFSSAFMGYEEQGRKLIMLAVLVLGLINSVIALFYYLKIPYYAFLKEARTGDISKWHSPVTKRQNFWSQENLLGLFLVLIILVLFFIPSLLMGWIIKINFAF